ncbi:uncharacterized protein LOC128388994 [Panonychus citri]|uniref:uncharacterized protein LOC128388994 n=1 Tax=Panonychus citri TaxID=50023 RepID=UPI002307BDBE|nr:uncharacterized protein LOC128388994 [Panonychus citri]
MSFNDLPVNCLWKIFGNVHEVEDLIRLSKVCSRWSDLITLRFNRVKYLRLINGQNDYIDKYTLWINRTDWKDYNLMESFPNLKIIEISSPDHLPIGNFNKNPKIKGLIDLHNAIKDDFKLENIEMFASERYDLDYEKVFRPDQLKQVYSYFLDMTDLPSFIKYFPNLRRLHLKLDDANEVFYDGVYLSSLKILELGTDSVIGFNFMDFCPSLESAFIHCWTEDINVDESIKNYNLRDLVIKNSINAPWPYLLRLQRLRRVLSKFPNLHHLGIRDMVEINDSNLEELVKLLPKLKILDLRTCVNVTEKSADILSKFCVKENRSIVMYYDCVKEPIEWPKLANTHEPICYGFNFMKHCFYKTFNDLPIFIDE